MNATRDFKTLRTVTLLVLMLGIGAASVFTVFGMTILYHAPEQAGRVGALLPILMKTPTWVYMLFVPLAVLILYWPRLGARNSLLMLAWGCAVGAGAELAGTNSGFPFGSYTYTSFLEPKILGDVPYLIPPSWYAMGMISWEFARRLTDRLASRVVVGSLCMVLWDLALDPAMSYGFPVWEWGVDGIFYGMPLVNLVGWFVTSLVIFTGFAAIDRQKAPAVGTWAEGMWLLSALLPLGICVVRGMWPGLIIGTVAVCLPIVALRVRGIPQAVRAGRPRLAA